MKTLAFLVTVIALAAVGCSTASDAAGRQPSIGDGEEPGASARSDAGVSASEAAKGGMAPTLGAAAPLPAASGSTPGASASGPSASPSSATPASSGTAGSAAAAPSTPSASSAGAPPPSASSAGALPSTDVAPAPGGGNGQVAAGILTAGTWDDNRNFDRFSKYRDALKKQQLHGLLPTTDDEHASAHTAFAQPHGARQTLDIALMIDTTGSMGDEIRYLQSEFLALSQSIEAKYPNAQQRWALVVYRDTTDEYVTRWYDFRENANDFRDKLALQAANGGGDFPEAPDAALAALTQLGWRTDDNTARLAFWVADAPHHDDKAEAMLDAIRDTRDLDVHLYPVASSGVDDLTELSMRTAAQLTGGRYLFLTDDSGVGGAHKEPSIPCYFVTRLDRAILRMVDIEISGSYHEPDAADVLRNGGDPQDGACKLESGETVAVF